MTRVFVTLLLFWLLLFGAVASAKPPASDGFVRIDAFSRALAGRFQTLKKAEDFEKKPMPEKLLIKYGEGEKSFGSVKRLTGAAVIEAIFEWDEFIGETKSEAADRVIKLLPEVVKNYYGNAVKRNPAFKNDRYKASKVLVDQLVKPPLHVRELAIECLKNMYGARRGYVAEDSKSKRKRRQSEWSSYIKQRKK